MPANGGTEAQVTRSGRSSALVAQDGEWIYYKRGWDQATGLWKVRPDGSGDTPAVDGTSPHGYAVTSRGLWFINRGQTATVDTLRFADGS